VGVYRLLDCLAALLALRGAWGPYRHYSQALRPWAADHVAARISKLPLSNRIRSHRIAKKKHTHMKKIGNKRRK